MPSAHATFELPGEPATLSTEHPDGEFRNLVTCPTAHVAIGPTTLRSVTFPPT